MPMDCSSDPVNISQHPDNDSHPRFSLDGKMLAFTGKRFGNERDIFYLYLERQDDELTSREVVSMSVAGPAEDGHVRYAGEFETRHAGRYGFTVRVVPRHPDLVSSAEMGLAAWA